MKQAVIYTRFSPRPDADTSMSCEFQEKKCREYCKLHEIDVLAVYEDRNISGKRADNRPGLQKAMVHVCKERGVLVVYSLLRLARSPKDAIVLSETLEKNKANLAMITENIDTSTPFGRFYYVVMAAYGALERETTAERTRAALKHRQDAGYRVGRFAPYGYKFDKSQPLKTTRVRKGKVKKVYSRIIENPKEMVIVNCIIGLHRQGMRIVEIRHYLNTHDIRPRRGTKIWQHTTIGSIIKRYG